MSLESLLLIIFTLPLGPLLLIILILSLGPLVVILLVPTHWVPIVMCVYIYGRWSG